MEHFNRITGNMLWILAYCCVIALKHVTGNDVTRLTIVTIISGDNRRLFSIDRVRPAMDYAVEMAHERGLVPANLELALNFSDSHCNAKDAPVAAFQYYMQRSVDIFIGPVCDYSLAPVARYAPYWDIPVITPGGFAHDFGDKFGKDPEFPTLTRIGNTFNSLARSIIHTANHYNWTKLKLIYDGDGKSDVSPRFCFLAGSALIYFIKDTYQFDHDYYLYVPRLMDIETVLREEVGNTYSGEYWTL